MATKKQTPKTTAAPAPGWKYEPALEATDHVRFEKRYGHFIDGKFTAAKSYFGAINPATEEQLAEFGQGSAAEVDTAVKSARRGYEKHWSKTPPSPGPRRS